MTRIFKRTKVHGRIQEILHLLQHVICGYQKKNHKKGEFKILHQFFSLIMTKKWLSLLFGSNYHGN
jgi:hypothetical protein